MKNYLDIFLGSYSGYCNYLKNEILSQLEWNNYIWGLVIASLLVWGLEIVFPRSKDQKIFRKDFWLDTFYMFFNFFLLNLIVFIALSNTLELVSGDVIMFLGPPLLGLQLFNVDTLPFGLSLFVFFLISDFLQWWVHRLLRRVPTLWNFHKVHHSIKEMNFAAQLRYHCMKPVIYKSCLYIPLVLIGGFDVCQVVIVHFFQLTVGHLNHANIDWYYAPLKYVFNNPKMHIWHRAKELPKHLRYETNFGLNLST